LRSLVHELPARGGAHEALTNPHSTAQWRVNGPVSDNPDFAAAFKCAAGSPWRRSTAARCVSAGTAILPVAAVAMPAIAVLAVVVIAVVVLVAGAVVVLEDVDGAADVLSMRPCSSPRSGRGAAAVPHHCCGSIRSVMFAWSSTTKLPSFFCFATAPS